EASENGERLDLHSPTHLPSASGFLWNRQMMIHMNCRGYAVAQFMQPEPAKYAHAPNLEAKTFMQPEQPYYAHHPGRFCYVKDEESGMLFSAPHQPVRAEPDSFTFSVGKHDLHWTVRKHELEIEMRLSLAPDEALELWDISIRNTSTRKRQVSLYPYFPIGYMSWMNQGGYYHTELQGIIGSCITPYQKYKDYDKIKTYKDKTFLLADCEPTAWEVNQANFEGEGGLHNPSGIQQPFLSKGDALYETPAAVLQYQLELEAGEKEAFRFLFGPARTEADIAATREWYFGTNDGFSKAREGYAAYVAKGNGLLEIETPDPEWDNFVNHWLVRQIYYHGETNRLSTDPQTRNYLQDNMGMAYIQPEVTRQAFINSLSQQEAGGAMPDGILLYPEAELKYINQVPHTDHCVWLPICLQAYLDETDDYALLNEEVPFADGSSATVREHIHRAMDFLMENRDTRGLSFIEQGDWCDPMNMVGPKGIGVSGWLTLATAYALRVWSDICAADGQTSKAEAFAAAAQIVNANANNHFWRGDWYARGITDDNVTFGVKENAPFRIFLY
ncbi:MAG: NdvB protein, partial [Bacteroidota bacterium]